jgi:cytidylate kinase
LLIVTIDGPAGAGKSTVAMAVANRLGFRYMDTGAMYRAVAWKVMREGVDPLDDAVLRGLVETTGIELLMQGGERMQVLLDGKDVSSKIRTAKVGQIASKVSSLRSVREKMVGLQQDMGREGRVVAEGRDMGTVVFPQARVKVYLDASPEERAERRYRDLRARGEKVTLDETLKDVHDRDRRDTGREFAPLRPAHNALRIDSTGLTVDAVVGLIIEEVRRKRSKTKDGRLVS